MEASADFKIERSTDTRGKYIKKFLMMKKNLVIKKGYVNILAFCKMNKALDKAMERNNKRIPLAEKNLNLCQ